jgi:hypothetical protein
MILLYGTCNPSGEADDYNGLYLKQDEIESLVKSGLGGTPVLQEHRGSPIGKVISTYVGKDGEMQCLIEVNDSSFEGMIATGFVRDGIASELSLGYTVAINQTKSNSFRTGAKQIKEISLVRKGARNGCYIHAHNAAPIPLEELNNAWGCFIESWGRE